MKVRLKPDPTDDRGRLQAGAEHKPFARLHPARIAGGIRLQAELQSDLQSDLDSGRKSF